LAHGRKTFNEIGADYSVAGNDAFSLQKCYEDIIGGLDYLIETVNNHPSL